MDESHLVARGVAARRIFFIERPALARREPPTIGPVIGHRLLRTPLLLALLSVVFSVGCASYRHVCVNKPCSSCAVEGAPEDFMQPLPEMSAPALPPIQRRPAQLSLAMETPSRVALGSPLHERLRVRNTGDQAAQRVVLRHPLPTGLRYLESDPPAQRESDYQLGDTLVWSLGDLAGGAEQRWEVHFQADVPGTIVSRAEVFSAEGLRADASASTEVVAGELRVTVTGPKRATVGQSVTFEITLTNVGSAPATNVRIVDRYDEGFVYGEYDYLPDGLELPVLPRLDPNQSRTFPLTLQGAKAGLLHNQVVVTADGSIRSEAEAVIDILPKPAGLNLLMRDLEDEASVGGKVTYEIRVENRGGLPARGLQIVAIVPTELALEKNTHEAPFSYREEAGRVIFGPEMLEAGKEWVLRVHTRAVKPGDARFKIQMSSEELQQPITEEEATTISQP